MRAKKLAAVFVALVLAVLPLSACGNDSEGVVQPDRVQKQPSGEQFDYEGNLAASDAVTVDGIADEDVWKEAGVLAYFGRGNDTANVRLYRGKSALYFFFEVRDTELLTEGNSPDETVCRGDSVEIYIDPNLDRSAKPNTDDVQLNLGIHSMARMCQGTGQGWSAWAGLIDYAVKPDGSLNEGEPGTDRGYTLEAMVPYSQLGIDAESTIGLGFGQVDKSKEGANVKDWFGWRYEGVQVDVQCPATYVYCEKDNTIYNENTIPKPDVTVRGVVREDCTKQPVAGATVTLDGRTATTDETGAYSFADVPPTKNLTITASKENFVENSATATMQELRDANGGSVIKDIEIHERPSNFVPGTVAGVLQTVNGGVAGARVSIEGEELSCMSGEDGSFRLEGANLLDSRIVVEKPGYLPARIAVAHAPGEVSENATEDLGTIDFRKEHAVWGLLTEKDYVKDANFAEFTAFATRGLDGVEFVFDSPHTDRFVQNASIMVHIDTKESHAENGKNKPVGQLTLNRDAFDYSLRLGCDGTLTANNWQRVGSGTAMSTAVSLALAEGDDYIYTVETLDGHTVVKLYLKYAAIGVTPTETFGLALGQNSKTGAWAVGQYLSGTSSLPIPAINVRPELTQDYIRFDRHNRLYWAENNALELGEQSFRFGTGNRVGTDIQDMDAADTVFANVARDAAGVSFTFTTFGNFSAEKREFIAIYFDLNGTREAGWSLGAGDKMVKVYADGTVYEKQNAQNVWWSTWKSGTNYAELSDGVTLLDNRAEVTRTLTPVDASIMAGGVLTGGRGKTVVTVRISYAELGVSTDAEFGVAFSEAVENNSNDYKRYFGCKFLERECDPADQAQYPRIKSDGTWSR